MDETRPRLAPGKVRDAILEVLEGGEGAMTLREIEDGVRSRIGSAPASSIRSYLRLNSGDLFVREDRGVYRARAREPVQTEIPIASGGIGIQRGRKTEDAPPADRLRVVSSTPERFRVSGVEMIRADCFEWLARRAPETIHAVVTDPPYGLHEYTDEQQQKLREGRGGVWRLPPSFDGHVRSPLPRFTTLSNDQLLELRRFFVRWGRLLLPRLVPGANVLVASNPLLSHIVASALSEAGLERRGEIIRLTMTMRGGDRPKAAHEEFSEVSVMPRSMWEPWLAYRRPPEGRVQDNLRKWKTGGFRRPSPDRPFGDVIASAPTRAAERALAPHPSLKPQAFLRTLVRAALPLGEGVVLDPFAGSGSTLAAAAAVGYTAIGVERDPRYFEVARESIPGLIRYRAASDVDTPSTS